ncbi:hypothetical protein DSM112329_01289 [Paraconexibacter sp. AEG42_29]|uniref:Cyclic nucleotide-binding domain-containing protein n=1 Tax=Paraconexibacter sp. AEG42_29 TaxID=2997339 RepID=A0AAU7AS39_9ACTN
MDAASFFQYPSGTDPDSGPPAVPHGAFQAGPTSFLADQGEADWAQLLAQTTTVRFRAGDTVLVAGAEDRAFYLLVAGRVAVDGADGPPIEAPAVLGDAAFFDGLPRAVAVTALGPGEAIRLSWQAFEALAVRHPRLAQALLGDLGRIAAARQRASAAQVGAFSG